MESVESQIAEWRAYVARAPGVNGHDVDELEDHLRHQIAELTAAGLTPDEGFLIAVKRLGDVDGLSREFAREHSGRLWKQLLAGRRRRACARGPAAGSRRSSFAVAAAVVDPGGTSRCRLPGRRADLVGAERQSVRAAVSRRVLRPPTAARHPRMGADGGAVRPRARSWSTSTRTGCGLRTTEALVALHLPVVLWFAVAYPYMGGTIRSHERRMDFVRFTGEWFIYYVLIALGGGVLMG